MTTPLQSPLTESVAQLRDRIIATPELGGGRLVSLVWIGSASRNVDLHEASDIDLQVVLDRPDAAATAALAHAFQPHPGIDLSVMYLSDIFGDDGRLVFQDGTKGAFFVHVLAGGVLLYGDDIYGAPAERLSLDIVRPSLSFTIREYLARLRVMVTLGSESVFAFKKYTLKLLRDVLAFTGDLSLADLAATSNREIAARAIAAWPALAAAELPDVATLTDLSRGLSDAEQHALLESVELIVRRAVIATQ